MKIVFATGIYPPEIGGPAGYVKGLANELTKQNHKVSVITYGDKQTEISSNYKVQIVNKSDSLPVRYAKYAYHCYKLAQEADLIYAQGPVSEGLPAAIASMLSRKPLVLKIVGDYAWEQCQQHSSERGFELLDEFVTHRHSGKIRVLETVERWVASRAKVIIVPSKYLKSVIENWGIESEKIQVISNSASNLPHVESREELRKQHEIGNKKMLFTAGRAISLKRVDFLLEILSELPSDFVLAVAGDGPTLKEWQKRAHLLQIQDRVAWLGSLDKTELTRFYKMADLFLLASSHETAPHVLIEAANSGLKCIASNKGGIPEIAKDHSEKISLLQYDDKVAWLEAIKSVDLAYDHSSKTQDSTRTIEHMSNQTIKALEESLTPSARQPSSKPKAISIGSERKLFQPGKVRDRIIGQLEGMEAVIIVFGKEQFDSQVADNVRVISTSSRHKFFYVFDAVRIIWKLRKQGYSVIVSQDPVEAGLVAYLASKLLKCALAIQDHGYYFHGDYYRKESLSNRLRYLLARYLVARADVLRVVSQRTEDSLLRLGISKHKIVRFPLTLDAKYQIANIKSPSSDERRGTSNMGRYFLLVCRFVPIKRIDLAIHAFSMIAKQNPSVKLKIVGHGPLENQIRRWISDFDLQSRIELIQWTEDLLSLYRDATATLITSDREGFGMTALESLAHGTPVIMTDVGCAGEVVKSGENGTIVPVGDVMAIANAMERYVTNCESLRIANMFTWNSSGKDMKDFLQLAVSNRQNTERKEDEDFWKFAESRQVSTDDIKLRLLFITQVVDKNDSILGFVVRWIQEFVDQGVKTTVFTRKMIPEDLPQGAFGQDLGQPVIRRVLNLWYYSVKYRKSYDKVLVHMTPQIVVLGWPIWFLLGKKVYMWHIHPKKSFWLKAALLLVRKAFTAVDVGIPFDTPKKAIVGHGIDLEKFKMTDQPRDPELLIVGRIHEIKQVDKILDIVKLYKDKYPEDVWTLKIIGSAEGHDDYMEKLKNQIQINGLKEQVQFLPPVAHDELPKIYQKGAAILHATEAGSMDKVVLEAMACGTPIFAVGKNYLALDGVNLLANDSSCLDKIHAIISKPKSEPKARYVISEKHNLSKLIQRITSIMLNK